MGGSMLDIQYATVENSRGEKKIVTTAAEYNGLPIRPQLQNNF